MKILRLSLCFLTFMLIGEMTIAQEESIVEAIILDSADIAADVAYNSGVQNLSNENFELALEDFTKAIMLKDSFELALYNRGLCYFSLKNYKLAVDDFDNAIALNSKAESWFKKRRGV